MNVLHLSHHSGCVAEIEYVAKEVGFDVEYMHFDGGYNIGHERAQIYWDKFKDKFNSYDVVFTSDTTPLARIILQNFRDFKGHLVIWVCNRFDYRDNSTLDCDFPDSEYYQLIRDASTNPRVQIVCYTRFESHYAKRKGVNLGTNTIKPIGKQLNTDLITQIPESVVKPDTFFIPDYHNDTKFVDLSNICNRLDIPNYRGRYGGPQDLKDFKGIIHIPYAWSNFALFENLQYNIPYFIPSLRFMNMCANRQQWRHILRGHVKDLFFWSPPFSVAELQFSEWYDPQNRHLFVFFESVDDLARKVNLANTDILKEKIASFCEYHTKTMLGKWRDVFSSIGKI